MRELRRGLLLLVAGVCVTALSLATLGAGAVMIGRAPSSRGVAVKPLRTLSERSTIIDASGSVIARLGVRDREDVRLREVPQVLQDAVVAAEDATFWTNRGIDVQGLTRAAWSNLQTGRVEQGGSTITQQLVKNRVLSSKRTAERKVREMVLALAYAKKYSKRQILEQYLNTVYFGQGAYGVKTAAERFFPTMSPFGVPLPGELQNLSLGQAALLAGSISNPEGNNPFLHPERARERRGEVLQRMVEEGYATQEAADAAAEEPLPTVLPVPDLRPRSAWAEEVQDRLLSDPRFTMLGETPAERERRLLTGGLTIQATLDPRVQAAADAAVEEVVPADRPDFAAALVAIEPATGAVRAMTAGRDFAESQYNLATSTPGRQAGSTWKVITLAAALNAGFSPQDPVDGSSPCVFPGLLGETQNFEPGGGVMTLRAATVGSVNCAYARAQLAVGLQTVMATASAMGVRQPLQPILTLTLGAIETTPLEMATVAATLASGGVRHWPNFVQQILDRDGTVIYDAGSDAGERVLPADVVACETSILQEVVNRGTGTNARLVGRPAAGKTGTTDGRSDANFLGFTPNLAAFVWYGNPSARLPGAGFGGEVPARVFKVFMDTALAEAPVIGFPEPGPVCARPAGARGRIPGATSPGPRSAPAPDLAPAPPPAPAAPPPAASPPAASPPPAPSPAAPPPTSPSGPGPGSGGPGSGGPGSEGPGPGGPGGGPGGGGPGGGDAEAGPADATAATDGG